MVEDPINMIWTVVGIFVWPGLTLCIILWKLGYPVLGVIALFVVSSGETGDAHVRTTVTRTR